jgi:hypothetical protein
MGYFLLLAAAVLNNPQLNWRFPSNQMDSRGPASFGADFKCKKGSVFEALLLMLLLLLVPVAFVSFGKRYPIHPLCPIYWQLQLVWHMSSYDPAESGPT